jgi:hypothetical protein
MFEAMRLGGLLVLVLATATLAAPPPGLFKTKLKRPARGFQIRTSTFEVPVGEREICQAVRLPVHRPIDIDRIAVRMPTGATILSHHFAMFLADASAPDLPLDGPINAVGCAGVGGSLVSPILAFVQRRGGDDIAFPKRVGVTLGADQVLLLNSHYVNVGDGPVTVDVAVNFHRARKGAVKLHAKSFQLGTGRINVPANGTAAVTSEWHAPFPMDVVWTSSHSHKYTEGVDVDVTTGGTTMPVVRTTSWSEPDFRYFPPPSLRLEVGDTVRWTCRYRNPTDHPVHFGVTADDEMCFAVGFFVTDDDGPIPALPPQLACLGGALGLVCPLN